MRQRNLERSKGYDRWRLPPIVAAMFDDCFEARYDRIGTGNFPEQDVRLYRGKEPLNLWIGVRTASLNAYYLLVDDEGYVYRRVISFELVDWMKKNPPWNNVKIKIYAAHIQFQALTAYWEKDIDAYLERRSRQYAQATS